MKKILLFLLLCTSLFASDIDRTVTSFEKAELYMMDINQRRPTKIAMGPEDKRFPAWEG